MTVQVNVTLSESIYRLLRQFALQRRQDIAEAIAQYLEQNPPALSEDTEASALDDQWEDSIDIERQAYLEMHPTLKSKYLGHHVAIYQGELIDHDVDGVALSCRIDKGYPDQFVLMCQVETEPERALYFRSPRFVENIL